MTAHIKVAQVVPSFYPAFHYGGPTQSTYALCRAVAQQGCTVRVLTTNANGLSETLNVPTDREVEVDGLRVRYCQRVARHSISPALLAQLREYVRWADVVHLMGVYNFTTFPTLVACRLYGKPLVWSPRGALQRWSGSRRPLLKQLWESAAKVVAPRRLALHVTSERELQQSQARIPAKIARVIPNAVEVPNQVQHTPRGDTLRLLFLGRLDPIKGIENLLEACRQLRGLKWSLTIAGTGQDGYLQSLKEGIHALTLEDRVNIIGPVSGAAKQRTFENADVCVVPSHSENFGIVVAEALAHGVPVIASRGTPWSRLDAERCGMWVENSPESLAEAIVKIAPRPLELMGQRGREWMKQEFSAERVGGEMVQLYGNVMIN